ncbi:MAG: universal stress protein [Candidatus Desulforudis sp.]|nr:universal stress protein [Desulforudis sp.]
MFNRILVATDGSDNAHAATEYALNLLRLHPEAKVVLINVFKVPTLREYDAHVSIENAYRKRSEEVLDEAAEAFEKENFLVEKVALPGDPGEVICQYAHETGCDHIIIGATGHSQLGAFLFGSVARKVTRLARCPVILICQSC